jgi:S1-C subfamily serine protease
MKVGMPNRRIRLFVLYLFAAVVTQAFPQSAVIRPTQGAQQESLKHRYHSLVCAIALITTERGTGTGFFVDERGDMVTAAHVVSTKKFQVVQGQILFNVDVDQHILLTPHGEPQVTLDSTTIDVDLQESSTDLAFIHTHKNPPCWIPLGDSSASETGDHLLSIGFPGIDNGNPILYEGFLSGRFKRPPISAIAVVNGVSIIPQYEVLKVQMPITPGASGSPIINDSGQVVAVISEVPMIWTQDLENITRAAGGDSGVRLSGFDVTRTLGQLATVVREFETTGSGYAVPISGLRPTRVVSHSKATPAH